MVQYVIDYILEKEGGYVDHDSDRGGPTNYGITKQVAREYGYEGPMEDLPEAVARAIYFNLYITKPGFLKIFDVDNYIGELVIDYGVHSGPGNAAATFQELLNVFNMKEEWWSDIVVDGIIGPNTMKAFKEFINKRGLEGKNVFAKAYKALRAVFYIQLAKNDESQEDFIYGWLAHRI